MKKRVTIHDIAKLAGVSSATVSRVLSNSGYPVSDKVRCRIQELADELHYIPNQIGKQLKTDINRTIGVIIPSISNPFYAAATLGIEETARKNGYQVFLCNSRQDGRLEEAYLQTLFEKQVKGVILSSISGSRDPIERLIRLGLQLVAIDQPLDVTEAVQIGFDYRQGGRMAALHLIGQGHRAISYVTASLDRPSRRQIYEGFTEALHEAGLSLPEGYLQITEESVLRESAEGSFECENGRALARKLLALPARPTAIFACNDMTAFGVLQQCAAEGVSVPDDVSVMGFDDILFSSMVSPGLTTIKQPDYEMGRLACEVLLARLDESGLEEKQEEAGQKLLKPRLIERASVKRLD
ncbi:LacI family DNA-binding transcriptional regulator [Paenibacillus sp. J31TS4]|uniref:LacI family DNA-binding transcriptional regulator n=1 Tax=Paenibacillus sp. J31TS4 TaxID=2807195 RepID=UPI001BD10538|nr:LacI family DNA-binding transcriptional regulator [Paenibacillus sp. J31TS4]